MTLQGAAVRALALVLALAALVFPGFGLIDLSVSWDPDWPVMLEAGWGMFFSVFVGLPFLLIAVRRRRSAAPFVQLWVSNACLALAGIVGAETPALITAMCLALAIGSVSSAARSERKSRVLWRRDWPLLALAAAALVPAVIYAVEMTVRNRQETATDITMGVDHYAVQAAAAVAVVALTAIAAWWPTGRRLLAGSAGLTAGYLGLVSYFWPGTPAGIDRGWSLLALAWGALVLGRAWAASHPHDAAPRPDGSAA
jgi:hypothetical protein